MEEETLVLRILLPGSKEGLMRVTVRMMDYCFMRIYLIFPMLLLGHQYNKHLHKLRKILKASSSREGRKNANICRISENGAEIERTDNGISYCITLILNLS